VSDLDDLPPTLMDEIEQFFHQLQQNLRPCIQADARGGAAEGMKLVKRSTAKVAKKNARGSPGWSGVTDKADSEFGYRFHVRTMFQIRNSLAYRCD
jgi:hypothetical protein